MKLTFDSQLPFQQDAVQSVTDLFAGQPSKDDSAEEFALMREDSLQIIAVGNHLMVDKEQIVENLRAVQKINEITPSAALDGMHFCVEMETGTGKTYVYLKTIYELNNLYGFRKFVIVVPSIAIREGVLKNLQITHEHFQNIYDNVPINFQVYNGGKVSRLRDFACNNTIEILVINIDSFAKDENIINHANDKLNGRRPIDFIQATHPIVIVDEPQNMETAKRKDAIENLHSLCTLRYSATHRNRYNLTYCLGPVKAYDLGLVKQIEVDSIVEEDAYNDAFISVASITARKRGVVAKVTIDSNEKNGVRRKKINIAIDNDLYRLSNKREIYAKGYIVNEIDAANNCILFANGIILHRGDTRGALTGEIMRMQIRRTITEHLTKELALNKKGIKVLSLFFIDRVANYRQYNAAGNPVPGRFALWFEALYRECMAEVRFAKLVKFPIRQTHNGYFSQDKKGHWKDTRETSASLNSNDSADTFRLIMRDKEELLNLDNPLRFIFSHSALREGWDNPNVFQICTMNETRSDIKKRQEIGRGLRLAVDQAGKRIYGNKNINRLTIIANEAYDDFAKTLQQEIEDDCGVEFKNRIKNKKQRTVIRYRKGFEADPKFLEIWEHLKKKTRYSVSYRTCELINSASRVVKDMPEIKAPSIRSIKMGIDMSSAGIETTYLSDRKEFYKHGGWRISDDILGYIQGKTELTRSTIYNILEKSGRIKDILINPQLFLDRSVQAIQATLDKIMINGIRYQKITGNAYEMSLFEAQELETYLDNTFWVNKKEKTIYEKFIPLDSKVEGGFAKDCESNEQVKFYFKLPTWFKIPTPIGSYNPDWAIIFELDKRIYFVAETKGPGTSQANMLNIRDSEQRKIQCARAHFDKFEAVDFRVVNTASEMFE